MGNGQLLLVGLEDPDIAVQNLVGVCTKMAGGICMYAKNLFTNGWAGIVRPTEKKERYNKVSSELATSCFLASSAVGSLILKPARRGGTYNGFFTSLPIYNQDLKILIFAR